MEGFTYFSPDVLRNVKGYQCHACKQAHMNGTTGSRIHRAITMMVILQRDIAPTSEILGTCSKNSRCFVNAAANFILVSSILEEFCQGER